MKKNQVIALIILIGVIVGGYFAIKGVQSFMDLRKYQKQVQDIKIENVDLSTVPDGIYVGNSEVLWIAAQVKVIVKDHKIVSIDLINHKNERGAEAEVIPGKVVEAQSLQVDTISGATNSSKVILDAIENALKIAAKQ
ncbi:MAG: hypothetical protein K0R50_2591 [Eubacterium sp.]|nr:hypothetical protein [Eubacterium sp.]